MSGDIFSFLKFSSFQQFTCTVSDSALQKHAVESLASEPSDSLFYNVSYRSKGVCVSVKIRDTSELHCCGPTVVFPHIECTTAMSLRG